MADDNQTPVFQIQRIYLKDLSLEQPNSPQILLEQSQPQVDINLALGAEPVADLAVDVPHEAVHRPEQVMLEAGLGAGGRDAEGRARVIQEPGAVHVRHVLRIEDHQA